MSQARIEQTADCVTIVTLRRYGKRGWEWTADLPAPVGGMLRVWCRTNRDGEGLWGRDLSGAEPWTQTRGTAQVSLPDDGQSARYHIRRLHAKALHP